MSTSGGSGGGGGASQGLSVVTYGAAVDSGPGHTIDSNTQIQNTLNALEARGGGDCWVPYTPNQFMITKIVIPPAVKLRYEDGAVFYINPAATTPPVTFTPAVAHVGTAVLGGTFDASGVSAVATITSVIYWVSAATLDGIEVAGNLVIGAPKHGIFLGGAATQTTAPKWVHHNRVEGHGLAGVGFGIYADYTGSYEVSSNYVENNNGDDCIELGHSGLAHLGIDANMDCHDNICVGGAIQFPFSDDANIHHNTVIGLPGLANPTPGSIQNDTNTANGVTIDSNDCLNSYPAAGYAAIVICGARGKITDNRVKVATGSGIQGLTQPLPNGVITGNMVESLLAAGAEAGVGIGSGSNGSTAGIANPAGVLIAGNQVFGGFAYGIGYSTSYVSAADNVIDLTGGASTIGYYVAPYSTLGCDVQHVSTRGGSVAGCTTPISDPGQSTGTIVWGNDIQGVTSPAPQVWAPATQYLAFLPVRLPNGVLGYAANTRTSGAAWGATEAALWTFTTTPPPNVGRTGIWLPVNPSSTAGALMTSAGNNVEYAFALPIIAVPIQGLGLYVTVIGAGASMVARLGLRSDDGTGRPGAVGSLIQDLGTVSLAALGFQPATAGMPYTPVPGQRLWATVTQQLATVTTYPTVIEAPAGLSQVPIGQSAAPAGITNALIGYDQTGVSGALPSGFATGFGACVASANTPLLWVLT